MKEITRREMVGAAAMAGAALTVFAGSAAADEKSDAAAEQAERQRVIACGFTEAEADCWI